MKVLSTTMALAFIIVLGANQLANATIIEPIGSGQVQSQIILVHGHGGHGGHGWGHGGHGWGHSWHHHHHWGWWGSGGNCSLTQFGWQCW